VPANTQIVVEARVANSIAGLGSAVFTPVANNANVCLPGRFIEVKTTLSTTVPGTSPVLSDIATVGKCDVNGDGVVNVMDITAINSGRNTSSTGACDMHDVDGSARIDTNDARQCAIKCTKPNCAL
jgi:hypothetical protein